MTSPRQIIDPEALLFALAQQEDPLPPSLQQSLTKVGRSIQADQPEAVSQLRELFQQNFSLESEYKKAMELADKSSSNDSGISDRDELLLNCILPSSNWVATAKQLTNNLKNPEQLSSAWYKTDRVAVLIAGGVALGSAVAQIPGAIVGGLIAAGYAWYIRLS